MDDDAKGTRMLLGPILIAVSLVVQQLTMSHQLKPLIPVAIGMGACSLYPTYLAITERV